MRFTLVVPTWNEVEGVRRIMPRVPRGLFEQIIILDGGSTDGTLELAREMGFATYVQKKPGFRNAYVEVLPLVTGDAIVTFSPDGNSIPELLPALVAKMREGYDLVIVSRYLDGAKSEDDDWATAFGNWLFTRTANLLHGGRYTDVMVIYRAYTKKLVYDLELDCDEGFAAAERLFRTRISWEPLMSVRAAKRRMRVAEIPGDEPGRVGGERKLQVLRWGAAYYFQFLREACAWK